MQSLQNMKNVSMMAQKSLQHMSATLQRMIYRFTVADDLKASSKITSQKEQSKKIVKEQIWLCHSFCEDVLASDFVKTDLW